MIVNLEEVKKAIENNVKPSQILYEVLKNGINEPFTIEGVPIVKRLKGKFYGGGILVLKAGFVTMEINVIKLLREHFHDLFELLDTPEGISWLSENLPSLISYLHKLSEPKVEGIGHG